MGFGALLATGDDNALLGSALSDCLIEVRVEQSLDEPTRFGLRVREDFRAGEPMAMRAAELSRGRMVTVAVQQDRQLIGLARGPITDTQSHFTLGGPGSWFEVHGTDRRIELSRTPYQYAWDCKASEAANKILGGNGFTTDIQETGRNYTADTQTLNQRGTDLDFLKTIARENGFFFWITLEASLSGMPGAGGSLTVTEHAHFKTSPYRATGDGGFPAPAAIVGLVANVTPVLRAGVGHDCGNNVTAFQVKEEVERPNTASMTAIDEKSLSTDSATGNDPSSTLASSGKPLRDVTGLDRALSITAAGNAGDVQARAQAALADTGWFITATASTTAHMLKGVLQPHDIVTVEAVGTRYSGPFRVRKVTHVITASDHFMDLELQSNSHSER